MGVVDGVSFGHGTQNAKRSRKKKKLKIPASRTSHHHPPTAFPAHIQRVRTQSEILSVFAASVPASSVGCATYHLLVWTGSSHSIKH